MMIDRDDNESFDHNDSEDEQNELNSCKEMINTNKANEKMSKLNCSLNLKDDYFVLDEKYNLKLLNESEIIYLKNLTCSPMIFATKILFKIFKPEELHNHNVSGKTSNKNKKKPLDERRLLYIKWLVEKHFKYAFKKNTNVWKCCCKAINRTIRKSEKMKQQEDEKKSSGGGGSKNNNKNNKTNSSSIDNCNVNSNDNDKNDDDDEDEDDNDNDDSN